jgi:four helix bundle protein
VTDVFDHEKLDVYRLTLEFIRWVSVLLKELHAQPGVASGEVRDQLDRASLSILLNTAEGNGKRQMPLRARYFDDARGSAMECAACLDALVAKQLTTAERILPGKQMLVRIVSMLSRMVERFSSGGYVREEQGEYGSALKVEDEDEDDDENERKKS